MEECHPGQVSAARRNGTDSQQRLQLRQALGAVFAGQNHQPGQSSFLPLFCQLSAGAAATYTLLKGLDLTGFLSYRKIDATLSDEGGIKTILKTGLHRTRREIARQDIASNTLVGGNINYRHQGWHIRYRFLYLFLPSADARKGAVVQAVCSRR